MDSSNHFKDFQDPLLSPLASRPDKGKKKIRNKKERADQATGRESGRKGRQSLLFLLAVAIGLLGYLLYQSNQRIHLLSSSLLASQSRLEEVGQELETSAGRIEQLNAGLTESQSILSSQKEELSRYKSLYTGLKTNQEQQVRTLETINSQKADREQVEGLQQETQELKENVEKTRTSVETLAARASQNETKIEAAAENLKAVQSATEANQQEIADVKRSLEREYYNFELQRRGGYMKVFEIALSLKDTDSAKRQFDLYLLADGKVIQKDDHPVNEPILFYVQDQKKPYEVVVTRVEKDFVVGYLSIPAS